MSDYSNYIIKAIFISFLLFMSLSMVNGQSPLFKVIDKSDGLPSNFVYRVLEDMDGFIWICTDGGVCKYDGQTMHCFDQSDGLPDKDIYKITLDELGRIWLFHESNKIAFIQNDSLHVFPTTSSTKMQRQYKNNGAEQGVRIGDDLYSIDGQNNITKERVDIRKYLFSGSNGLFWHDMYFSPTSDMDTLKVINTLNHSSKELLDVNVKAQSISQYHQPTETFQVYTGNRLYIYDTLFAIKEILEVETTTDLDVHSALRDKWGNLWICSRNGVLFQSYGRRVHRISYQNDSKGINVIKILESKEGPIIIGNNGGVFRQLVNEFQFINKRPVYTGLIYNAEISDSVLYLSNGVTGLYRINISGNKKPIFEEVQGGTKDFVIVEGTRAFSTGSRSKVVNLKDKTYNTINEKTSKSISYDRTNRRLWMNSFDTLYIYNDNQEMDIFRSIEFPQIEDLIYLGNGKTMIITFEGTNYICTDIDCEKVKFDNDVHINSVKISNDIVWLNTDEGILKFTFQGQSNKDYSVEKYFDYRSIESDIIVNDIFLRDDKILLGTDDGLMKIDEINVPKSPTTIPISINTFNSSPVENGNITLDYDERNITIEYNARYFTSRKYLHYKYYLEGTDIDTVTTNLPEARYVDLAPGDYKFKVKAIDDFGNESNSVELNFIISKPWFYRPSIYIFGFLTLVTIGYLMFKSYISRVYKRNELQQQFAELELSALQSQMNPHFVFNAMNSIQNLIASSRLEEADLYVSRLATLMRKYLESSKEKYIRIDEEIDIVKTYLQLEELRFGNKISYHIDNKLGKEDIVKRMPATIVQPFVENALKHGLFHKKEKGNLYIRLYKDLSNIYIEIEDDGVGRKKIQEIQGSSNRAHKSTGMESMKNKLEVLTKLDKIDVEYSVIDLYEGKKACGTKVIIRMRNN